MSNSQLQSGIKGKKGTKNFRWTPSMSRFLVLFLARQVTSEGKVHKSFRRHELEGAALAVNEKFKAGITESNIENHLKTVRARYAQIKRLRNISGATFNETEKMIVMEEGAYAAYVEAHPLDEPYLNKRIDLYDELAILCDIDHTTESLFNDCTENIPEDPERGGNDAALAISGYTEFEDTDDGELPKTNHLPTSNGPTRASKKAKKSRRIRNSINNLAVQIREVAEAIKSSYKGISLELFTEVMKCEGYDETLLEKAFDYLNEHENLARAFLVKNQRMRQAWLVKFFSDDASAG